MPRDLKIAAYILSCAERTRICGETAAALAATDWKDTPGIEMDRTGVPRKQDRQERTAWRLLQTAVEDAPDFFLFLEDDLRFNLHLRHNLEHWGPLNGVEPGGYFFGSLYNPNICSIRQCRERAFFIADPRCVYGSQAFVLSRSVAQYVVEHWGEVVGMQDIKMSRLAARLCPIYYHVPSLVQHVGVISTWGGRFHRAADFNAEWKSAGINA